MAESKSESESKEKEEATEATDEQMSQYWDEAVAARGESGSDERQDISVSESKDEEPVTSPEVEPQEDTEEAEEDSEKEEVAGEEPEDEPDDPWVGVPDKLKYEFEELKKQKEKYEHSARSNSGRLGAMQKKIDDLSRKLEEQSSAKDGKAESPAADTGDTLFDAPEWAKFKEDFGEVALPIEAAIRRSYQDLHSRLSETQKVSKTLQERQQEEYYAQQAQALNQVRPDWLEYAKENFSEMEEFANSDPDMRAIWDANYERITNAKQMNRFLTLFDIEVKKPNGKDTKPASRNASSEAAHEAKPNNEPRPMTPKRKQQLKSAASPAPRSHPSPGSRQDGLPDSDDPAALFEYWAARATR